MSSGLFKNRYQVIKQLENQGGMGFVVFAKDTLNMSDVVIKFCKADNDEELKNRFKREVRLLQKYKDSGYVIPIIDSDLDTPPFYFVMPMAEGDLSEICHWGLEEKEKIFYRMIDCLGYIHDQGDLHRDVKPENFLRYNGSIVVSDLGLAKDPSSLTQFTKSIDVRGTPVYAPPNFFEPDGGFKNPTREDDLFSLGKTFYFILCGQVPFYILRNNMPASLFEIIRKSTSHDRIDRYNSCLSLQEDLRKAFDIVFTRIDLSSEYVILKRDLFVSGSAIWRNNELIGKFISMLVDQNTEEQVSVFKEISESLFQYTCTENGMIQKTSELLAIYKNIFDYVSSQGYWPFSYAEKVANDISIIFRSSLIPADIKALGLKIAMGFAISMSRVAAGETCARMIESVKEDGLAFLVGQVISEIEADFISVECVNTGACQHNHLIKILLERKKKNSL